MVELRKANPSLNPDESHKYPLAWLRTGALLPKTKRVE